VSGIHVWQDPGGPPVVAAFSSPFFASTWMLVPQTMTWFDAANDTNVAVDRLELSVLTPDASWTVIGNGNATVDGSRFRFAIDRPVPVYAVRFAASPAYVTVDGGQAAASAERRCVRHVEQGGSEPPGYRWPGRGLARSEHRRVSLVRTAHDLAGIRILAATATLAVAAQPTAVAIDPEALHPAPARRSRLGPTADLKRGPLSH
jgi:hypothetical protein